MQKRKPDFWIEAFNASTEDKAKVGTAFKNGDGSITIDLNPFVVLTSTLDLNIRLLPITRGKTEE